MLRTRTKLAIAASATIGVCAGGQSIDERLSEETFLQALSEYGLPEVLEYYIEKNPSNDPVQQRIFEITADRMRIVSPGTRAGEKLRLIEGVLSSRQRLIDDHPFDPRTPVWLADQAADLFFLLYPVEATRVTVEFGLASPEQRLRADRIARDMKTFAAEAELVISETILDLESEPGYQDDISLQLKRRRLARDERDRRIPFLHGVGAYLNAELGTADESEKRSNFELAAELLLPLTRELDGSLQNRARLYAGFALARLGRFDEAKPLFAAVRRSPDAEPLDIFAARMGIVKNQRITGGEERAIRELHSVEANYTGAEGVFFRMLIADQRFLLRRAIAMGESGAARTRLLVEAFAAYTDLLDADLGVAAETVRSIVFRKLANAADRDVPLDQLPPIVTVARAANLAREESTRAEAIDLFKRSLQRSQPGDLSQPAAIFGLARAHFADHDWVEAARRFDQLAREHPLDQQAERSIGIAVALLFDLQRKAPDSIEVATQLDDTLDLLFGRYPNVADIDRWRYEAARVALARSRFPQARSYLSSIPPGSTWWIDSRVLSVQIMRTEVASATGGESGAQSAHEKQLKDIAEVRSIIEREAADAPDQARAAVLDGFLSRLNVYEAQAHLALGDANAAIARLDGIVERTDIDRATLGEALAVRINALQQAGRGDDAQREIRELMDRMPERAGYIVRARIDSVREAIDMLLARNQRTEARNKAVADLIPLAENLSAWMRTATLLEEEQTALHLAIADAYRLAERFDDALPLYQRVLAVQPDTLRALFGRAESLFGNARNATTDDERSRFGAEAIKEYKRISNARFSQLDSYYWQSELRMLQILDLVDVGPRKKRQILARIEVLRIYDEDLGGDRFRPRFNELLNKYQQGG